MNSDDFATFFLGAIISGVITALFCAFVVGDTVRQHSIEKGQVLCANNNGLKQIDAYFYSDNVICHNGAVFNIKEIVK